MIDKALAGLTYDEWSARLDLIPDPRDRTIFQIEYADFIQAAMERDQQSKDLDESRESRKKKAEIARVQREELAKIALERRERMGSQPNAIPRAWIADGAWSELSGGAKNVCVVLRRMCKSDGGWIHIKRNELAIFTGLSEDQVSRMLTEVANAGWIRRVLFMSDRKSSEGHLLFFSLPKPGKLRQLNVPLQRIKGSVKDWMNALMAEEKKRTKDMKSGLGEE